MLKRRTKASALPYVPLSLEVNNRSDKGTCATHTLDSHHRLRATQRRHCMSDIPVRLYNTHVSVVSIGV